MDFEKIELDKKITTSFDKGEKLVFSYKIIKFSGGNQPIPRILAITTKNIYNIIP